MVSSRAALLLSTVCACVYPTNAVTTTGLENSSTTSNPSETGVAWTVMATATSSSSTTTSTGVTTSTGGSTDDSTAGASGTFIVQSDYGSPYTCDVVAQDCPPGMKCTFDSGSLWQGGTICVDVVDDPAGLGEACHIDASGDFDGDDDCGLGAICWWPYEGNVGHCIPFCTGPDDAPSCPDGWICLGARWGSWCVEACDPLAQDCSVPTDNCVPHYYDSQNQFSCINDGSGDDGQAHDPCYVWNSCDKGLFCANPEDAVECAPREACCEPFCRVSQGDGQCPGLGQVCAPWEWDGDPLPGLEDLGSCKLLP